MNFRLSDGPLLIKLRCSGEKTTAQYFSISAAAEFFGYRVDFYLLFIAFEFYRGGLLPVLSEKSDFEFCKRLAKTYKFVVL